MAIGDAVIVVLGTGAQVNQPASGIEQHFSFFSKGAETDALQIYDGSTTIIIIAASVQNVDDPANATTRAGGDYNVACNITNAIYLQKTGSTDNIIVSGVITNV